MMAVHSFSVHDKLPRFIAVVLFLHISACSTLPRDPLPLGKADRAESLGMSSVRAPSGKVSPHLQADIIASLDQELPGYFTGENGQRH